jgi:hypothetical protein
MIKLSNASVELKIQFLCEITITVFQFTQRAIENRSACHAWHACSRLPTHGLNHVSRYACGSFDTVIVWGRILLRLCPKSRKVADWIPEGVIGHGVDSASNRDEYQEYFLGSQGGRCVGLTTLPP